MRLIDADALDEAMTKFSDAMGEDMTHAIFYAHIAPTIDAVPVRHGKWIPRYIKIAGRDYKHGMQCSVCAEPALDVEGDDYLTDYCPWCGARMDAERREE